MLEMSRLSLLKQTEDAAAKRSLATHLVALHKTENNYAERPEPARVDLCASFTAWAEQTASQQVRIRRYFADFFDISIVPRTSSVQRVQSWIFGPVGHLVIGF